ncbi:alpha-mannosidase isoform X2 [Cryptomeria japonica]|uniref:alpha-mannosidase isoform X2 n=1 Tax=Cryptomeria japonica TaxID=3369 RepID=UPI0027DA5B81|nr:alpha-mannosidase isoform X2 [Cryptomeria japonica]
MSSREGVECLILLLALMALNANAGLPQYNTTSGVVAGKLNVHLVPHTHDDVGWLKTVDQYYIGSNNSIQAAAVQYILDSVLSALQEDKNRKFIYVEQAFFQRWWRDISDQKQAQVRKIVESGQLEFINGGMCMHDEATTHYIDMIDQTTLGHRFIKKEFGKIPCIGWQIDPFGHSAVQAYLLGTELGFDSLFFGRIDYQDRQKRKDQKTLEVVWQGSKTFGASSQIFTSIFPEGYGPPDGFYFDVNEESSIPVQDDPLLFDYNVQERVNDFVNAAIIQANVTRTNHIMWTMGTDFQYQYAKSWFKEMDKLIHYVNKDGRVNALYSTPSIYADLKHAANESWPLKLDDFFPYADSENAYWTGYFTSRPALKGYVRMLSGYYLAARQLEFLVGRKRLGQNTAFLGDALAIAQHHDAVSGTAKQHTTNDYAKRLFIGASKVEEMVNSALVCLTNSTLNSQCGNVETGFQQCSLLNISYCPESEANLTNNTSLVLVAYNSLGWKRIETIRIPVNSDSLIVTDTDGNTIQSQLVQISKTSSNLRSYYLMAYLGVQSNQTPMFWLVFTVSVPPLGFSTYVISTSKGKGGEATISTIQKPKVTKNETVEVGQGNLRLTFSTATGLLALIQNHRTGIDMPIQQSYLWYESDTGSSTDNQPSGAYIFRPNGSAHSAFSEPVPLTLFRGPLLDEIHQEFNSWIYQITRIYKDKEHVEVEFNVGPIPIDDGVGKEVITKLTTNMSTNGVFYTDSNGRDFLKRVRNYRSDWNLQVNQPVSGNYYPINSGIYTTDNETELSVLVDRPVGGSSIQDGQLELMLHRRCLNDDLRGVDEALNETVCVQDNCKGLTIQGKYYFSIDAIIDGAKWRRTIGQEIYSPLLLAFTHQGDDWTTSHVSKFMAMDPTYSLPKNVAIITLEELEDGSVLLRLAHIYEAGEDAVYSNIAAVELKMLFPNKMISELTEMNLSANQEKSVMKLKEWKVDGYDGKQQLEVGVRGGPVDKYKMVIELGPMEIRTFILFFK